MDSTNSDEEDSSSQGKPSERPKAAEGSDARAGINFKSNNETCGVFLGKEVNEEISNDKRTQTKCTPTVGSGSGIYFKEGTNKKKDTFEGMPMVSTAQDTLRRNSTGLRGEHRFGKSWDVNYEMEAKLIPRDPFDLSDNIFKDKGQDAYSDMEAQMLLLKKHRENNLDDGPSTLLSPLPSDPRKKHKETLTNGVSSYRGTQSNSDVDLDKCLANFTKSVRQNRGNLVKKKNNKYSSPKNRSPSPSKQGS
ncbi:hypothetical protein Ancab_000333 [Ancistrocladus abbreviatus]